MITENLLGTNGARLSILDLVFQVMDSPERPLDFTLVLQLANAPSLPALKLGASSARNLYPATGSCLDGMRWIRLNETACGIRTQIAETARDAERAIEEFINSRFELRHEVPVRQLVLAEARGQKTRLVTRFHHAAADGLSGAMWLSHQLAVARGEASPVHASRRFRRPQLLTSYSRVRKSRFAFRGRSERLWRAAGRTPTGTRRWRTIKLELRALRERLGRVGGLTFNAVLATCVLEALRQWKQAHDVSQPNRLGLWIPINIRKPIP